MATKRSADKAAVKPGKIFVLDTSVILYNHNAIMEFADNDVAIPITVLEELDNFKKGNTIKNFEAREFIRFLDSISGKSTMKNWRRLNGPEKGRFKVVMNENSKTDARSIFNDNKADHRILNAALKLQEENPDKKVILVSKDINLRLKAKSLSLTAEDFETGKVQNIDSLYTGSSFVEDVDPFGINFDTDLIPFIQPGPLKSPYNNLFITSPCMYISFWTNIIYEFNHCIDSVFTLCYLNMFWANTYFNITEILWYPHLSQSQ